MSEKTFSDQLFDLGLEAGKFIIEFMKGKDEYIFHWKNLEYDGKYVHSINRLENGKLYICYGANREYVMIDFLSDDVLKVITDHLKTVKQDETAKSVSS